MTVFWPDVSHYQVRVDDSFDRPFLMFKVSEGTGYVDPHAAGNLAWALRNCGPGKKLVGFGGYHVWHPGQVQAQVDLFIRNFSTSPYAVAMTDVESWGGRIRGDHSAGITDFNDLLAGRLSQKRVCTYANSGDFANIYPNRPDWLKLVRARYSALKPAGPFSVWQYSDGASKWPVRPGYPRKSAPFGACDHNVFPGSLGEFIAAFGLPSRHTTPAPAPKPSALDITEEIMSYYKDKAAFEAALEKAADKALARHEQRIFTDNDVSTAHPNGRLHKAITLVRRSAWADTQWRASNVARDAAASKAAGK